MKKSSSGTLSHKTLAGLVVAGCLFTLGSLGTSHAQSTVPGADRTQGANYNSNQPPGSLGSSASKGNTASYNGFNPQTGTWSGSNLPTMSPTNDYNAQSGTWAGSASTATGGVWSTGTGSGGGSINIFTPSQGVSGSSSASSLSGGSGKMNNGPNVIPHVTVRSRTPIYNRVPIRPQL